MRSLLIKGFLVYEIDAHWLHVGIHALNPRRPTFLNMQLRDLIVWGHRVVKPMYDDHGDCMLQSAMDFCSQLDLTTPKALTIHKLISFKRPIKHWKPDALLTIKQLGADVIASNPITFWRGSEKEWS